jgi:dihydrofolate reductase
MKITLCMEMSLNGFIARENGDEDFIPDSGFQNWLEVIRSSKYVMWGRKTHNVVLAWEQAWQDELKGMNIVVVSADPGYQVDDRFKKASSPREAFRVFEQMGANNVFLSGGSELNSSFAKLGLIDELVVTVEPVAIGRGIPLFSPEISDLKLKLLDMKQLETGAVQLKYQVLR